MRVTVFGGSQPPPGNGFYQDAMCLGAMLAREGHEVLTGGYIGSMEAVSRGAAEAGGHVIGVTCQQIEDWRKVSPNHWVHEEWRYATLRERLHALIDGCDAALALPGGAGTLVEISLMWNEMIVQSIPTRPLIVIGPGWKTTFTQLLDSLGEFVAEHDRRFLTFAPDVDAAIAELRRHTAA
ncbi:MAG: LOG family protein [Chloroflexi bacterium]|nr:LOG family protein [Chloroflexota bacterium]MCL4561654.1 LOG family protein [Chloroflexota bacterium]